MPVRFQVDPDFYDHPKTVDLDDDAVALWTRAGSYSAAKLLDGFVPDSILSRLSKTPTESAAKLVRSGLWRRARGGYQFHQWGQRNLTKDVVEKDREKDRERKRNARGRGTSDHPVTNEDQSSTNREGIGESSGNGREDDEKPSNEASPQVNGTDVRAESERNPDGIPEDSKRSVSVSVSVSKSGSSEVSSDTQVSSENDHDADVRTEPRSRPVSMAARKLSRAYTDIVKLVDVGKLCAIITQAQHAGYADDLIEPALSRLGQDKRTVTPETLRIEIEGGGKPRLPHGMTIDNNGVTRLATGMPVAGPGWEAY